MVVKMLTINQEYTHHLGQSCVAQSVFSPGPGYHGNKPHTVVALFLYHLHNHALSSSEQHQHRLKH